MNNVKSKGRTAQRPAQSLRSLRTTQLSPVVRTSSTAATDSSAKKTQLYATKIDDCIDRAFRIPIFLSTSNTLNNVQEQFMNRLIMEIEDALLFPRTLPESEQYPETILTSIRRLVISSYGLLAINFRRFFVQFLKSNTGQPPVTAPFWEGSVFLQIEPAMAFQFGLPILLVREKGTDTSNGLWSSGITPLNIFVEWDSDNQTVDEFFSSVQWREVLANWAAEVRANFYNRTEPSFRVPN